ncbi:MAG: DUF1592 domain-containing protein [Myxococcales bacterium]|nr:DUF1592 domain-containing protein [Myxococcales bacterium]
MLAFTRRPGHRRPRAALALALAACGAYACGGGDGETDGDDALAGDAARGAELYLAMCAQCHGPTGEGGKGPPLAGWSRGQDALIDAVEVTMPEAAPENCVGQCPVDIAAYILGGFEAEPLVCDDGGPALGRRQLRLLTRHEYNNTVRDLLGLVDDGVEPTPDGCALDTDCALTSESCVGDLCVADPCALHTFVFDPQGQDRASVHVAGSFNGWPATLADGGWPMVYVPEAGLWVTKQVLGDGEHQYKFVLDESEWVHDAGNPDTVDDGNGGLNSRLTQDCAGAPDPAPDPGGAALDPAADFPIESRPDGYFYDNNADAGLVTAVHVEHYLRAGEELAALATADLDALLPCTAGDSDETCADAFTRELGARAFRRPLREDEVARYTARILAAPNLEEGVAIALRVMLSSPYFLYRFELGAPEGDRYRLSPHEQASALSYLLWASAPDDELREAADGGALAEPGALEAQARRMLADPRSREVVARFAEQWLGVESVATLEKSAALFPGFTADVRAAMSHETRAFVEHVVFDSSHGFDELLTADYTFADAALASYYGVAGGPDAVGEFAQVSLPASRAGLLGHGSVLASTAHSDQSSPVRRGLWVRRRLLCQELGQPPPDAGGVPEVDPDATTRERFRQHSESPGCFACHQYIDELGFGFERFDAAGRYREQENGQPVDGAGLLNDVEGLGSGTEVQFQELRGLADALVAADSARACFARQYYRFASGALEQSQDACAIAAVEQRWAEAGYDIRELIIAIILSPGFTQRQ